jgi:hypothetical protein
MYKSLVTAVALAATATSLQAQLPAPAAAFANSQLNSSALLPEDTPVRLMVVKEVNSRTAHSGDRVRLRVNEPVYINDVLVVSVGTTAWAEVADVEQNGAAGKAGKLGVNLLYLDLPSGQIPLRGEIAHRGDGNGAGVAMAIVGFGVLGLLTGGDSARLKAGETFVGYVGKVIGGPVTSTAVEKAKIAQATATGAEQSSDAPR